MIQVDLSFKEVTGTAHAPCFVCKRKGSSHRKEGDDRFWKISGKGFEGEIVCDTCLIISRAIAQKKREEMSNGVR